MLYLYIIILNNVYIAVLHDGHNKYELDLA